MKKTHQFIIRRRKKVISKELPLIFGISGVARCGKDTLGKHLINKLNKSGFPALNISFATELKRDLDPFLKEKLDISAFTENNSEKDIIRPMLVCWGTDTCRKIDPEYWIKKIEKQVRSSINNKIIVVITDVRYENEAKWIKENGGFLIHLSRMGQKPSNFQERLNDPIVKRNADHIIRWKTFTDEKETCNYHLSKLFFEKGWSTYGDFK
jgi:phosphomevalonate kinase